MIPPSPRAAPPVRADALVDTLAALAPRRTSADRDGKLRVLAALARADLRAPRALVRLHEALCFLQAYPDDRAVLAAVDRALTVFPARVTRLRPSATARLRDTGIAGTTLDYPFGLPMTRWLVSRFPRDVDVRWDAFTETDRLQESLALLLHRDEHDAWSDEGGLGWRRWLDLARGGRR